MIALPVLAPYASGRDGLHDLTGATNLELRGCAIPNPELRRLKDVNDVRGHTRVTVMFASEIVGVRLMGMVTLGSVGVVVPSSSEMIEMLGSMATMGA